MSHLRGAREQSTKMYWWDGVECRECYPLSSHRSNYMSDFWKFFDFCRFCRFMTCLNRNLHSLLLRPLWRHWLYDWVRKPFAYYAEESVLATMLAVSELIIIQMINELQNGTTNSVWKLKISENHVRHKRQVKIRHHLTYLNELGMIWFASRQKKHFWSLVYVPDGMYNLFASIWPVSSRWLWLTPLLRMKW